MMALRTLAGNIGVPVGEELTDEDLRAERYRQGQIRAKQSHGKSPNNCNTVAAQHLLHLIFYSSQRNRKPMSSVVQRLQEQKYMILKRVVLGLAIFAFPGTMHAQELTGTLKKITDTRSITIGYRETSVPFSYLDADNRPVGFAMDICAKIVDAVKKELKDNKIQTKYVAVTASTRIPLIANGTGDLECGSMTNNAKRQKKVSYTNSHFLSVSKKVTKKSSHIKADP